MDYTPSFTVQIDLASGAIPVPGIIQRRFLSDMPGYYADADAENALKAANPLIYEVHYGWDAPKIDGQLSFGTTIIHPGRVGDEFFMTKGHYHAKAQCAEVYYGLSGTGVLLLMTPQGETQYQEMRAGTVAYVPPYMAHRTVNVGSDNFVFLSLFAADAGYDYGSIEQSGFASIVVADGAGYRVIANPRFNGVTR